jgi:pimeloyl-ACP methyl ester carboxylesterase
LTERITSYTHDGLTFDVRDEGPIGGVPTVLLHGFPERSSSWDAVVPLLHEQGIRTLAPDQRGYSPGARPRRRRDYRMSALTGDVEALIALVGGPVHLVGHDWGSAVAWTLAARRPDLVRTLTAVSVPHPAAFLRAMVTSSQGLRSWYMLFFQLPLIPELLARRPGGLFDRAMRGAGMRRAERARCREEIIEYGALPGAFAWYRAVPLTPRSELAVPAVTVPTTFVWSDQDSAIGRVGPRLTARYVDADYSFEVLEGVSHWIPTEAPGRLAEAILRRARDSAAAT